ncbi:ATP-binding protein [Dactylosporangium sp. NPDC000555]|uniref:AAA family ATPase n=1 Tax=Dactylosporangium sp. NPDC000555 TaxID=3154260 RepID=UPI0033238A56
MLLSFRFANHRSFLDEQHLNLTPMYTRSDEQVIADEAVPVVGIFGANASGKSNALHALAFMRRMAIDSDRAVEPELNLIDRECFHLDPVAQDNPSRYVVDLSINGVRHTYGFTINDECILEEWLYYYPLKKRRRVFEREGDEYSWGDESRKQTDLERISSITAPTALFLSTVARFSRRGVISDGPEPQPLHDTYRWFFRTRARSRPGGRPMHVLGRVFPESEENRRIIIDLLRAADIGILDVLVYQPTEQETLFDLEDYDGVSRTSTRTQRLSAVPPRNRKRLFFSHRGPNGPGLIPIEQESTGTQQLLDLSIDAAVILKDGGTMTVDEIDASLHPMLTAKLIGLFKSKSTNPHQSQLIFTSHDAALLGTFDTEEVLARDEIWFTEKGEDGTSTLYPLTEFKPRREGENRQRRYLNGNYGGVPDLSTYLFERALAGRDDE